MIIKITKIYTHLKYQILKYMTHKYIPILKQFWKNLLMKPTQYKMKFKIYLFAIYKNVRKAMIDEKTSFIA